MGPPWPPAPAPNVAPPPDSRHHAAAGFRYDLLASTDGRTWHIVAHVTATSGTTDTLSFPGVRAAYVRVHVLSAPQGVRPMLQELTVPR